MSFNCDFGSPSIEVPPECRTFGRLLKIQAQQNPERRFLGQREFLQNGQRGPFEWYSFKEVHRLCVSLARGLLLLNIKRGDRVGLLSGNRPEWTMIEYACALSGIVLVPIYDTQSAEDIAYVLKDAGVNVCFVALDRIEKLPPLEKIIVLDDRIDDRAFILEKSQHLQLPMRILTQMRSQIIFDERDSEQGIYDPSPTPLQSTSAHRSSMDSKGFYQYKVPQSVQRIDITPDLSKVTHTFWQLIMAGHAEMFPNSSQNEIQIADAVFEMNEWLEKEDELFCLVYTSGTTGKPKGVMLSQFNIIYTSYLVRQTRFTLEKECYNSLGQLMPNQRQEFILGYLPLAHIYMRVQQAMALICGGAVGFGLCTPAALFDDLHDLRITFFGMVPRIAQKLIQAINSKIDKAPPQEQQIFKQMFQQRVDHLKECKLQQAAALWKSFDENTFPKEPEFIDRARLDFPLNTVAAFKQFPDMLGGRCRVIVYGSVPLSPADGEFLAVCFNIHAYEGWGMTETGCNGLLQSIDTLWYGAVGKPCDCGTGIRIVSVPEMEYSVEDSRVVELGGRSHLLKCPRGELLINGPSLCAGYWGDTEKTQESFIDGYFRTGDIAEFNPLTKEIKLIDRKRGIIKLNIGEFISVSKIEEAIGKSQLVDSVYLWANSFDAFVMAAVVPNTTAFAALGLGEPFYENQNAMKLLLEDVRKVCAAQKLQKFEIPRALIMASEPWTPANGMLTPGMKVNRRACKAKYEATFTNLATSIQNVEVGDISTLVQKIHDAQK